MKFRKATGRILQVEYTITIVRTGDVSIHLEEGDDEWKAIQQAVWDDIRERISRQVDPEDGDDIGYDLTDDDDIHEDDDEVDSSPT